MSDNLCSNAFMLHHMIMASEVSPQSPSSHARTLLTHLLYKLRSRSSRHHSRYGEYLESAPEQIEALICNSVRPEVLRHIEHRVLHSQDAYVSPNTYTVNQRNAAQSSNHLLTAQSSIPPGPRALNSPTTFHGRSIYLHTIYDLDGRVRLYVGQAYNAAFRISQHLDFRYRREHRSLHYHAMEQSSSDSFVILAALTASSTQPGMQRPDLVLNILEMWCCLLFQTLQPAQLEEWLPPGCEVRENVGRLNVALPLDQGGTRAARCTIKLLKDSRDPLVHEYYDLVRRKPSPDPQAEDGDAAMTSAGKIALVAWGVCAAALAIRYFMQRRSA